MDHLTHVTFCVTAFLVHVGHPLTATNKVSLASWGSYNYRDHKGPGTYAYGYDIEDPVTGNIQFRQEERHSNGIVTGSYGYVDANGIPQVTHYISDKNGYRIVPGRPSSPEAAGIPQRYPNRGDHNTLGLSDVHTDRIRNPPHIMYEFQGSAPFLTYYRNVLSPLTFAYARK